MMADRGSPPQSQSESKSDPKPPLNSPSFPGPGFTTNTLNTHSALFTAYIDQQAHKLTASTRARLSQVEAQLQASQEEVALVNSLRKRDALYLDDLQKQLESSQKDLKSREEDNERLCVFIRESNGKLQRDATEERQKREGIEAELSRLRGEYQKLQKDALDARSEAESLSGTVAVMERSLSDQKFEAASLRMSISEAKNSYASLAKEFAALTESSRKEQRSLLDEMKKAEAEFSIKLETATRQSADHETKAKELSAKLEKSTVHVRLLVKEIERLNHESRESSSVITALQHQVDGASLASHQEVAHLQEQLTNLHSLHSHTLAESAQKVDRYAQQSAQLQDELSRVMAESDSNRALAEKEVSQMKDELASMETKLKSAEEYLYGAERQTNDLHRQLEDSKEENRLATESYMKRISSLDATLRHHDLAFLADSDVLKPTLRLISVGERLQELVSQCSPDAPSQIARFPDLLTENADPVIPIISLLVDQLPRFHDEKQQLQRTIDSQNQLISSLEMTLKANSEAVTRPSKTTSSRATSPFAEAQSTNAPVSEHAQVLVTSTTVVDPAITLSHSEPQTSVPAPIVPLRISGTTSLTPPSTDRDQTPYLDSDTASRFSTEGSAANTTYVNPTATERIATAANNDVAGAPNPKRKRGRPKKSDKKTTQPKSYSKASGEPSTLASSMETGTETSTRSTSLGSLSNVVHPENIDISVHWRPREAQEVVAPILNRDLECLPENRDIDASTGARQAWDTSGYGRSSLGSLSALIHPDTSSPMTKSNSQEGREASRGLKRSWDSPEVDIDTKRARTTEAWQDHLDPSSSSSADPGISVDTITFNTDQDSMHETLTSPPNLGSSETDSSKSNTTSLLISDNSAQEHSASTRSTADPTSRISIDFLSGNDHPEQGHPAGTVPSPSSTSMADQTIPAPSVFINNDLEQDSTNLNPADPNATTTPSLSNDGSELLDHASTEQPSVIKEAIISKRKRGRPKKSDRAKLKREEVSSGLIPPDVAIPTKREKRSGEAHDAVESETRTKRPKTSESIQDCSVPTSSSMAGPSMIGDRGQTPTPVPSAVASPSNNTDTEQGPSGPASDLRSNSAVHSVTATVPLTTSTNDSEQETSSPAAISTVDPTNEMANTTSLPTDVDPEQLPPSLPPLPIPESSLIASISSVASDVANCNSDGTANSSSARHRTTNGPKRKSKRPKKGAKALSATLTPSFLEPLSPSTDHSQQGPSTNSTADTNNIPNGSLSFIHNSELSTDLDETTNTTTATTETNQGQPEESTKIMSLSSSSNPTTPTISASLPLDVTGGAPERGEDTILSDVKPQRFRTSKGRFARASASASAFASASASARTSPGLISCVPAPDDSPKRGTSPSTNLSLASPSIETNKITTSTPTPIPTRKFHKMEVVIMTAPHLTPNSQMPTPPQSQEVRSQSEASASAIVMRKKASGARTTFRPAGLPSKPRVSSVPIVESPTTETIQPEPVITKGAGGRMSTRATRASIASNSNTKVDQITTRAGRRREQ